MNHVKYFMLIHGDSHIPIGYFACVIYIYPICLIIIIIIYMIYHIYWELIEMHVAINRAVSNFSALSFPAS